MMTVKVCIAVLCNSYRDVGISQSANISFGSNLQCRNFFLPKSLAQFFFSWEIDWKVNAAIFSGPLSVNEFSMVLWFSNSIVQ